MQLVIAFSIDATNIYLRKGIQGYRVLEVDGLAMRKVATQSQLSGALATLSRRREELVLF